MLADREFIGRYADIRSYTSQATTRLEVVASDDDPRISQALGESDYHHAVQLLDHHYNLILLDTGTGILDSATQGILREAHQIVVVMPPALDGARGAASTLDWLDQHGHAALVRGAIAVINAVRGEGGLLELDRVGDFRLPLRSHGTHSVGPGPRGWRSDCAGRPESAHPGRLHAPGRRGCRWLQFFGGSAMRRAAVGLLTALLLFAQAPTASARDALVNTAVACRRSER